MPQSRFLRCGADCRERNVWWEDAAGAVCSPCCGAVSAFAALLVALLKHVLTHHAASRDAWA